MENNCTEIVLVTLSQRIEKLEERANSEKRVLLTMLDVIENLQRTAQNHQKSIRMMFDLLPPPSPKGEVKTNQYGDLDAGVV